MRVACSPFLGPHFDILLQALTVEPRFAAVDIAHVQEATEWGIFCSTVISGHENMVFGRDGDGNGVVERSGCGIRVPVHGVDTDFGAGNDG